MLQPQTVLTAVRRPTACRTAARRLRPSQAKELAAALGGPVLLSKGPVDIITDGQQQLVVSADGSPRRCGGQGDVLTGGR